MAKKDYYKILDVDKNFTEDQLKKNYKKLCLKYHPDRLAGKSEEEKKAAEEKFKDIQEAYECLSDADKRAHYDRFGSMDNYGQGWSAGADMFSHFSSFFDDFDFPGFGNMFGGMGGHHQYNQYNRGPEPGQNLRIQIGINLKEILDGGEKTIKYTRNVRCNTCGGSGGTGVETCPHCHGTGMITTTQRSGFGIIQNTRPCNYCNGTGKIIKNKCKACNGEGLVKHENTIKVKIPRGCKNGQTTVISGAGCESKTSGVPSGDLQVIFLHQYDNNRYLVQGNIIYEKIEIPYYDAILGKQLHLTIPNGHKIDLTIKPYTQNEDNVYGDTVNGYEYRYIVIVSMPKKINNEEKKLLEKIRKEHK